MKLFIWNCGIKGIIWNLTDPEDVVLSGSVVPVNLFGGAKFGGSDAVVFPETFGEISGR